MKGLLKKKGGNNSLFQHLDELFDIPKEKEIPTKTKEELMDEFEEYVKGV